MMAKVDVKSAYHNIPVHPKDRWMMGMMWEGALYVDTCLPFGLRSAPKIFMAIADAVEWIVRREGASGIMHYLDDFLVVGAPNSSECAATLTTLLRVFDWLGLPVALEKLEGPLGIFRIRVGLRGNGYPFATAENCGSYNFTSSLG